MITSLVENLVFPECLRWRDRHLWFTDMYAGCLLKMAPDGTCETLHETNSILGGIGWLPDGQLIFVDKIKRKILALRNGETTVYADLSKLGHSPLNDLLVLSDGKILVGEYGFDVAARASFQKGAVFAISATGDIQELPIRFSFPNGMVETAAGREIILAETMGARLTKVSLGATPLECSQSPLKTFSEGYPDGLSLGGNGWVWSALVDASALQAVDPSGQTQSTIKLEVQPYDVCWVDDPERLYVAVSAAAPQDLKSAPLPRKGAILEIKL